MRAFKGPKGGARMRKPLEIYVTSRMQNLVQIRAWSVCSRQKDFLFFCNNSFGALGVESPHSGVIGQNALLLEEDLVELGASVAASPTASHKSRHEDDPAGR